MSVFIEDLSVGQKASLSNLITDHHLTGFAELTGDTNPVHLDEAYAQTTMFKGRIAHGMLAAGFISAVLGTKLPGAGCIYMGQTMKFKAPVRIGDTVVTEVEIKEIIAEKKRVILTTTCRVGDVVVVEGEATLMVPSSAA